MKVEGFKYTPREELMVSGYELASMQFNYGHISFPDFARSMMEFTSEKVHPYIKMFYNSIRFWPGFEVYAGQMTHYDEVDAFDLNSLLPVSEEEEEEEEYYYDEEKDEDYQAFKRLAFEIIRDGDGDMDCQSWVNILVGHNETADVFGNDDPPYVFAQLTEYWSDMDYKDPDTGVCFTYRDWALYFQNWTHQEVYSKLSKLSQ